MLTSIMGGMARSRFWHEAIQGSLRRLLVSTLGRAGLLRLVKAAIMTSPAMKRKCGSNDLSPFAVKLPKFERTGNQIDDEKNKNYWIQLQQMITGCQSNPELVPIVYGVQQMLAQTGEWQLSEMFSLVPKHLYSLPDEFVFEFLVKNSGLQADHLGAIQKRDPKGPHKILLGMVQLPSTLTLEGDMVCRGCMKFLCKDRYDLCGRRMHNLKGSGNYADGQVFWADCGSYQCDVADNKLIKVQRRSSGPWSCTSRPVGRCLTTGPT